MNDLETLTKLREFIDSKSPYGILTFRNQPIIVLPTVFPPIFNTEMLSIVVEDQAKNFLKKYNQCRVFEMGVGSGAAILQVAKTEGIIASGSDISPMAVLNTKANALWWGVQCDVYQGNLFDNVPQGKHHLIFWNIPFVQDNLKGTEDIKFRSAFDHNYQYFQSFLEQVNNRLFEDGQIVLGVDYRLTNLEEVYKLLKQAGFNSEVIRESQMVVDGVKETYLYLLVTKKFN